MALVATAAGLALPRPAASQEPPARKIIRRVAVEGLKREPEADILARLRIRVGQTYDPRRVSEETGHLYATGKFRSVEHRVTEFDDGVAVTFVVEERAQVTAVRLEGRAALSRRHLTTGAPALRTQAGSLLNQAHLQEDREILLEKYRDAGYIFAQVETRLENVEGGVRVTFQLREGSRVRVRRVEFVGNRSVASSTLLGLMTTREKDFWFFGLIRPGFYDYDVLERDLRSLERYYQSIGYFDARAELEDLSLDDHKARMAITIRVEEGDQYTFRGYRFENNRVFSSQTLHDLTVAVPGLPFNSEVMEKDRQEVSNYYGDRAYIDAQVESRPDYDVEKKDVYIAFEIEEGNEIYIEEIKVRGNVKTQDVVVRREVELQPGERVDRSRLEKSRSNLNRLQIFSSARYSFEEGSSPGNKNLVWTVEEEASGRLIVGFGVTSGFGVIGNFSITKRNFDITDLPESFYDIPDAFTGRGQTLTLRAQPGTRRSLYQLSLTEPYLFGTRNALTVSASSLSVVREDWQEARATFAPSIAHAFDFDRDLVFTLGGRLEEVELHDVEDDAPTDAFEAEGFTSVISASAGIGYDKVLVEYLEGPYDGTESALSYEYAGDPVLTGDLDFDKIELTNKFFYPVYTYQSGRDTLHHVVSLVNRAGLIESRSSDDIPIFERFFLGGPNTVRGFRFRGLGPHENGDPTGGTATLWGNVEYSFPIFQKILRGVTYFDYGNLAPDIEDFDFSDMRYTVGAGLRVNFPFLGQPLPIGLYFGTPVERESSDRKRVFLFTIGLPF